MAAITNPMSTSTSFTSFTITQPFLGAPLNFQPTLGSKALDTLINAFVAGPATKQDKLSQVTIDFYNHAQVDLSTGALVRTYQVAVSPMVAGQAYEQSPATSNSSGFSPSSSVNFGDSGYMTGGTTLTQKSVSRISKKPRKETKKSAEIRLPGFSIMTKDGIDVTSSAGRGTKTKEQREHAHLMRIMKACDACKKKKIRCDPSHRRSHTDMSRTPSTSASSARNASSPSTSLPSLSRQTTQASSQESLPSFGSTMDDFVLFPEDASAWEAADMSITEFNNCDLSQFNFDITDMGLNDFSTAVDQSFTFNSFEEQSAFQSCYTPVLDDQYGLNQWASAMGGSQTVSHSRPHPSSDGQDSGQLDSSWYSSGSDNLGSFNDSPISPRTTPGLNDWSHDLSQPQALEASPAANTGAHAHALPHLDWSVYDLDSFGTVSQTDNVQSATVEGLNRKERRSRKRAHVEEIHQLVDSVPSLDATEPRLVSPEQLQPSTLSRPETTTKQISGYSSIGDPSVDGVYALLNMSLEAFKAAPPGFEVLSSELIQLRDTLDKVNLHVATLIQTKPTTTLLQQVESDLQSLFTGVEDMSTTLVRPQPQRLPALEHMSTAPVLRQHQKTHNLDTEAHPEHLNQITLNVRRLLRSICATIPTLQTPAAATIVSASSSPLLTSDCSPRHRVSSSVSSSLLPSIDSSDIDDCVGYDGGSSGYSTQVSSPADSTDSVSRGEAWAETRDISHAARLDSSDTDSRVREYPEARRVLLQSFVHTGESTSMASLSTSPPLLSSVRTAASSLITRTVDSDLGSDISLSVLPSSVPTFSLASPSSSDGTISDHFSPSTSLDDQTSSSHTSKPSLHEHSSSEGHQLTTTQHLLTTSTTKQARPPPTALFPFPSHTASRPSSLLSRSEEFAWGAIPQTGATLVHTFSLAGMPSSQLASMLSRFVLGFLLVVLHVGFLNIMIPYPTNLHSAFTLPIMSLVLFALAAICTEPRTTGCLETGVRGFFAAAAELSTLHFHTSRISSPSKAQPWSKIMSGLSRGVRGIRVA